MTTGALITMTIMLMMLITVASHTPTQYYVNRDIIVLRPCASTVLAVIACLSVCLSHVLVFFSSSSTITAAWTALTSIFLKIWIIHFAESKAWSFVLCQLPYFTSGPFLPCELCYSTVLAVIVCLSVCLAQVGVVQRWLNIGSD